MTRLSLRFVVTSVSRRLHKAGGLLSCSGSMKMLEATGWNAPMGRLSNREDDEEAMNEDALRE
jgi:hypothetical protein